MIYKLLCLILLASCSSKYFKNDPTLDDVENIGSEITIPVQVIEDTKDLKVEVISCYASPEVTKNKEKPIELKIEKVETEIKPLYTPWVVGEKLHYEVHAVGMNAAQVDVEVLPMKILRGKKVWHFSSKAKTKNFASSLYYFNSAAESFIDEQLDIQEYRSSAFEGDSKQIVVEKYNTKDKQYYLYKKIDNEVVTNKSKEQKYNGQLVDLVSVFYYVRLAKLGEEISLFNNHKQKKLKVVQIENETLVINEKTYFVEKLTLKYGEKTHTVYRKRDSSKHVVKALVDLKFASGTIILTE